MDLSVVVPVYNEGENIPILYSELKDVLSNLKKTHEIIFVDDGSRDNTASEIEKLCKKDNTVKLIQLRKNTAKAGALMAGFKYASGDFVITMDGDLQDDPNEIPKFVEAIKGADLIVGWKFKRQDPITKTIPSKIFNKLTSILTGVKVHDSNCNFRIFRKEVVEDLNVYGELFRYIPTLVHWKGYKVDEVKINHRPRKFGKSKWGMTRLFKGFFDLLTVKFLLTFAQRPLHLFGTIGAVLSFIGFLIGLYMTYLWSQGITIWDRPLLNLGILLMMVGIQFISIGLLGELITSTKQKEDIEKNIKKKL